MAMQPCLVCGRTPADPHHLRFALPRAMSRKVSDEFTVPLCRLHHRELHTHGDEKIWWKRINIDPLPIALRLWEQGRSDRTIGSTTEAPVAQTGLGARADEAADRRAVPEVTATLLTDQGTRP